MKKLFATLLLVLLTTMVWAQNDSVMNLLKADPRRAYGTDYPYPEETASLTKAPKGYKPFYISHYGRHGSRYYWNGLLYAQMDSLLTKAHSRGLLTTEGEAFYRRFMEAKNELMTGVSELSDLGWQQHQRIARTMYNNFQEVFRKGGNVMAISSLTGRCVLSMSAFCQELVQCNPKLEIREQSSRFTLDGVVPGDRQNPVKHSFPKPKPRYEKNRDQFKGSDTLRDVAVKRVFTTIDSLQRLTRWNKGSIDSLQRLTRWNIGSNLINLYTSLPNIGHEGMMGGIITDEEIMNQWEEANLGSYSWLFPDQFIMIPILQDIIKKADAAINGGSDHIADLRFGHDNCLGPLTILMGINGADRDPEDPYEVKNCYQNWETCMASNIQLVFYRSKKHPAKHQQPPTVHPLENRNHQQPPTVHPLEYGDILVKCLLNGAEARLPIPTDNYPYYKWSDLRQFYTARCNSVQ